MVAVVLLGAGASYGSGTTMPAPPPLGKDLFARLEQQGGLAATLPAELKALFKRDFEAGMAELYHKNGDVQRFQRELARYIAQFSPGQDNAYVRLICELGVHRVIYVSLNYDLLFELSASRLGLATFYGIDKQAGAVRLIKPHGSCNVWPAVPPSMFVNCRFEGDFVTTTTILGPEETIQRCLVDSSLAPSMSVIAPGKKLYMAPNWVNQQQAHWRAIVAKASKVFVAGVRVHEIDEHIWGVLGACKGSVTVFGFSEQDRDEFTTWKRRSEKTNARFVQANFKNSIPLMKASIHGK